MHELCVCATRSLQSKKALEYTFGASSLEVLSGHWLCKTPTIKYLSYPYIKPQYMVCPQNKPINRWESLQSLPLAIS